MQLSAEHYRLGKIAFEAYCKQSDGKSLVTGATLPTFEGFSQPIRDAWASAAIAVAREVERTKTL